MPKKVIVYNNIKRKKSRKKTVLGPEEALIQCLNLLDLNAAIAAANPDKKRLMTESTGLN